MTESNSEPLHFQTSRSFQFFYFLPLLLAAALAVDMVLNARTSNWVGVAGMGLLALFTVPRALSRVALDDQYLSLHVPFRSTRQLLLRQLSGVERSGRMGHALLLRYRPMDAQGRLDIANELFVGLPPLERQFELEEKLHEIVHR